MYVTPITDKITSEHLENVFSEYGELDKIVLARDISNIERNDFAFINFVNEKDANEALKHKDGIWCNGQKLNISHARKPDRSAKNNRKLQSNPTYMYQQCIIYIII